jgi:Eco29kI restriction endonuclease
MRIIFDREKHIYQSDIFEEIIKDTIRFFNGTPVHQLPLPVKFHGAGVYAIYYTGKSRYYKNFYDQNRLEYHQPIYVGKAVPSGWRQARERKPNAVTFELCRRLNEHAKSINHAKNLNQEDFFVDL